MTGAAELLVRASNVDQCAYSRFPGSEAFLPDPDLGWVLKPGFDAYITYERHRISINSMGLRCPEIPGKQAEEFRILCLGESGTFGAGLANGLAYPSLLEKLLNHDGGDSRFRVINAGVPAWSSFQSREFLRLKGADLRPDLVVVYHEMNDYLPALVRKSYYNLFGENASDEELYGSASFRPLSALAERSALVRFMLKTKLLLHLRSGQYFQGGNDFERIGMPGMTPAFLLNGEVNNLPEAPDKAPYPRRVTDRERLNNLFAMKALCKEMKAGAYYNPSMLRLHGKT